MGSRTVAARGRRWTGWERVVLGAGVLLSMGLLLALAACQRASVPVPPPDPYVGSATATSVQPGTPVQQPTPTPIPGEPLAATVNGHPIYLRDYQTQVAEWEVAFVAQNENMNAEEKQAMLAQGRRQVLDVMIEQALIELAAAKEGVTLKDAEVESVITRDIQENGGRDQFDAWLKANEWTYEEYKLRQRSMMISSQMFERVTQNVPTHAEQVHARHVLVATEAEARDILSKLQAGADLGEMARQYSLDPSTKENGGDLGFFPRGTLVVPELEDVAFSLSVGQISDVISSPMGYHVVQVLERVQDKELTEESWQALKEATFRHWVSELWDAASIQIHVEL